MDPRARSKWKYEESSSCQKLLFDNFRQAYVALINQIIIEHFIDDTYRAKFVVCLA